MPPEPGLVDIALGEEEEMAGRGKKIFLAEKGVKLGFVGGKVGVEDFYFVFYISRGGFVFGEAEDVVKRVSSSATGGQIKSKNAGCCYAGFGGMDVL